MHDMRTELVNPDTAPFKTASTESGTQTLQYRAEIDGLRAVAVIPVILFHAGFETFAGGFIGVDVFFVISGYLITTLLCEDLKKDQLNLLHFYERRARRLLPALFTVMAVCVPFAWVWMLPSQLKDFSQSLVATSLFSSNILFWLESGYFDAAAEQKPLLHTWSLAVEEQFYLVYPLFLASIWALGRNRLIGVLFACAFVSLLLSEWASRTQPDANFYLAPFRLWELMVGALAAIVLRQWNIPPNGSLAFLGLLLILGAVFGFHETTPSPSLVTVLPVLGTACIILFAGPTTWITRVLSLKPLVGIGLISYSAYLWHQPLFAFARIRMFETPSMLMLLLLSMLSIVLAYLTWRWIERPFRAQHRSKYFLSFCALMTVLFVGLGLAGHLTGGFKNRFNIVLKGDVGHVTFHQVLDTNYLDCEPQFIAEKALQWEGFLRCKQSRPGPMDWILLGDSHAEHLFLGLSETNPTKNVGFYIQNGKPYLTNPQFQEIFTVLADSPPATIFLTMYYAPRLEPNNDLAAEYASVIEYLLAHGHSVVLVGDIPDFEVSPERCILGNKHRTFARQCAAPRGVFDTQRAVYEPILEALADKYSIPFIPIHASLCDSETCSMVQADTILYRDNNHLNLPGSRLIGDYLTQRLDLSPRR